MFDRTAPVERRWIPVKSQAPKDDEGRVDQDRVRAAGLRRVALASVAALAVVLPLAAAVHENARPLATGDAPATGPFKR
jgi:hypothetical protein